MGQLTGKKKLQAATLLETIVALVIILVIFGIVTTFLAQAGSSFSLEKIKATQLLNKYAEDTNESKAFFDEEISSDNSYIRREIIAGELKDKAVNIKFSLYDRDHKLITIQQRLFYLK